jgi:predicted ArsR family transcriptional regulator
MDQPTRKLLSLLGSESCAAICGRLGTAGATKTELVQELGLVSRDVSGVLDSLALVGFVRSRRAGAEGRGRPAEIWELVANEELEELEALVKVIRHRLIDASGK